jgi:hypothetical protein
VGFSGSYLFPIPFYLNLDAEVTTNWEEAPLFGFPNEEGEIEAGGKRSQPSYDFRTSTFTDFSEQVNGTFGISYAHGKNNAQGTQNSQVVGLDATLRWKDPRRAIYRSLIWQTEAYFTQRQEIDGDLDAFGMFSYVEYQFARRWRCGVRGDYVDDPTERGALAYLTFWPSEFSAISAQGRVVRRGEQKSVYAAYLKLTFNIGPHGAHPF